MEIFNHIVIIILTIVAVIVCYILRKNRVYMISLFVSIFSLFVMIILTFNALIPLYNDIKNNAFIKRENVSFSCPVNKFDFSGIQEIKVKEKNTTFILKTTKRFEENEFKGTIVYAKESQYLVFCQLDKTGDKTGDGSVIEP